MRTWTTWLLGVLLLAGLCFGVARFTDVQRWAVLAQNARPGWLALALAFQVATYACIAFVWRVTLRQTGSRVPLRTLLPLSVAKLYSDQVLPSGGVSGSALVVGALTRLGIGTTAAFAVLIVMMLGYYAAYLAVDAVALLVLWLNHGLGPLTLAIALLLSIVAVVIPATVLWVRRDGGDSRLLRLLPSGFSDLLRAFAEVPDTIVHNSRLLLTSALTQGGIFLLDAGTLWCTLHAVGLDSSFWVALPSFVFASMVATLGPIPLGLGTFEAMSVATLTALGSPLQAALAATLLLRGLTVWLPMLPGLWFTRGALRTHAPG
jgi:hypothetical protein